MRHAALQSVADNPFPRLAHVLPPIVTGDPSHRLPPVNFVFSMMGLFSFSGSSLFSLLLFSFSWKLLFALALLLSLPSFSLLLLLLLLLSFSLKLLFALALLLSLPLSSLLLFPFSSKLLFALALLLLLPLFS